MQIIRDIATLHRAVAALKVAERGSTKSGARLAIDGKPVHHIFLIVAPPLEVSNQYLPTLGQLAGFAKEPGNLEKLDLVKSAGEFLELFGPKRS